MARFLDVIDFNYDRIGEDWNFLILGNYEEYPSSLAPDICRKCLTSFGQIPGGNVRNGCHCCTLDNLKNPHFDCGWPYKVMEILRASDPFLRFHYAIALNIHKEIREAKADGQIQHTATKQPHTAGTNTSNSQGKRFKL